MSLAGLRRREDVSAGANPAPDGPKPEGDESAPPWVVRTSQFPFWRCVWEACGTALCAHSGRRLLTLCRLQEEVP